MNYYRITKYNPKFRRDDTYLKDEWTEYSDIGKTFGGQVFRKEDYLQVENNYIMCVSDILNASGIKGFYIKNYEEYTNNLAWHNEQYVVAESIAEIMKDCLRNKCWCRLMADGYYIHFGYDYYMYGAFDLTVDVVAEIED